MKSSKTMRIMIAAIILLASAGCKELNEADFWQGFWNNIDIILSHSGIAGVILLFWFADRIWTNRLIWKLNDTITKAIINNTEALSGLKATLQMGYPGRAENLRGRGSGNPQTGYDGGEGCPG